MVFVGNGCVVVGGKHGDAARDPGADPGGVLEGDLAGVLLEARPEIWWWSFLQQVGLSCSSSSAGATKAQSSSSALIDSAVLADRSWDRSLTAVVEALASRRTGCSAWMRCCAATAQSCVLQGGVTESRMSAGPLKVFFTTPLGWMTM